MQDLAEMVVQPPPHVKAPSLPATPKDDSILGLVTEFDRLHGTIQTAAPKVCITVQALRDRTLELSPAIDDDQQVPQEITGLLEACENAGRNVQFYNLRLNLNKIERILVSVDPGEKIKVNVRALERRLTHFALDGLPILHRAMHNLNFQQVETSCLLERVKLRFDRAMRDGGKLQNAYLHLAAILELSRYDESRFLALFEFVVEGALTRGLRPLEALDILTSVAFVFSSFSESRHLSVCVVDYMATLRP